MMSFAKRLTLRRASIGVIVLVAQSVMGSAGAATTITPPYQSAVSGRSIVPDLSGLGQSTATASADTTGKLTISGSSQSMSPAGAVLTTPYLGTAFGLGGTRSYAFGKVVQVVPVTNTVITTYTITVAFDQVSADASTNVNPPPAPYVYTWFAYAAVTVKLSVSCNWPTGYDGRETFDLLVKGTTPIKLTSTVTCGAGAGRITISPVLSGTSEAWGTASARFSGTAAVGNISVSP